MLCGDSAVPFNQDERILYLFQSHFTKYIESDDGRETMGSTANSYLLCRQ